MDQPTTKKPAPFDKGEATSAAAAATPKAATPSDPSTAPDAGMSVKDWAAWCLDFIRDEDWAARVAELQTPEKEVALKQAGLGEITAFVQELRHVAAKRAHILKPRPRRSSTRPRRQSNRSSPQTTSPQASVFSELSSGVLRGRETQGARHDTQGTGG